ncbi:MAG: PD40 domain-containing protein [Anaerolineae bacterium]|nr:PD40 domain-containing protein [Anaerolineae bacterium]
MKTKIGRILVIPAMSLLAVFFLIFCWLNRKPQFLDLSGPYLGQKPPGIKAELFAPGIIPNDLHSVTIFSPDGTQVYWKEMDPSKTHLFFSELVNDRWTVPSSASFGSILFDSDDPCFSIDGQKLFFTSWRPVKWYSPLPHKERIWYVEKQRHGWSKPKPVADAVNAMDIHWQMSVTQDETLYFASDGDIYRSTFSHGQYAAPEKLGAAINADSNQGTPFIAPDESYLLFSSDRRDGSYGMYDLYISFRQANGAWSQASNLGADVNSSGQELYPYVSPDGRFLFFLSNRGTSRVYWLDAQIVEQFEPKRDERCHRKRGDI